MKHTPAPWQLGYDSGDTVEIVTHISSPGKPGEEVTIAEVITEFEIPDGSSGEANAALDCAAPCLLAASQAAYSLIGPQFTGPLLDARLQLAAAIKKARGES